MHRPAPRIAPSVARTLVASAVVAPAAVGVVMLAAIGVVALAAPAGAHPLGAGPPPTAELSADGREVRVAWTAPDDDVADLLEHLGLVPEGTSEQYRWWAVGEPLSRTEREVASADPALAGYVADRVVVRQAGEACPGDVEVADDVINEGLEVRFVCPEPVASVEVEIALLHDVDPDYRTVGFVGEPGSGEFAAFTSSSPVHAMRLGATSGSGGGGDPAAGLGALSAWLGVGASAEERARALAQAEPTLPALAAAVVAAAAVGAGHGLAPGHAKAATAAYVSGGPGRRRDAVAIGALVALAHTGTVLVIGAALHLLPWDPGGAVAWTPGLAVAAGLVIAGVGVVMLRRHRRGGHGHVHGPADDLAHEHGPAGDGVPERGQARGRDPVHERGGRAAPRRRELAAVGLAGGLLPSPTALVLLGATWAAGRVEVGLVLVAAFGVGLAGTVTAVALLALQGRDALRRHGERNPWAQRLAGAIPLAAALVVTASGTLIAAAGLAGML